MAEVLAKGSRITGDQRAALGGRLAERYAAGESIRAISADTGRSFGFVHGLIKESGVPLRTRGGATRGRSAGASTAPRPPAVVSPAGDRDGGAETTTRGRGGAKASTKDGRAKDGKTSGTARAHLEKDLAKKSAKKDGGKKKGRKS